jgi:hypothetical protein
MRWFWFRPPQKSWPGSNAPAILGLFRSLHMRRRADAIGLLPFNLSTCYCSSDNNHNHSHNTDMNVL